MNKFSFSDLPFTANKDKDIMANIITIIILPSQKYLCINSSQHRKGARSQTIAASSASLPAMKQCPPPCVWVCGNHPETDLCCGLTTTAHLTHTRKALLML